MLTDDPARSALRTMGEQAIPVLQKAAANGDLQSVDDLGEIATATAASALIALTGEQATSHSAPHGGSPPCSAAQRLRTDSGSRG